ncbi:MAG TPA: hypothetical protein VF153_06600 [Candidatus Limnocylindria bacterium]
MAGETLQIGTGNDSPIIPITGVTFGIDGSVILYAGPGTKVRVAAGTQRGGMVPSMAGLPEALTLSSLVAGTLEYAILIRHREDRRVGDELDDLTARLGHEALMRMRLIERARPQRAWGSFGSRFR